MTLVPTRHSHKGYNSDTPGETVYESLAAFESVFDVRREVAPPDAVRGARSAAQSSSSLYCVLWLHPRTHQLVVVYVELPSPYPHSQSSHATERGTASGSACLQPATPTLDDGNVSHTGQGRGRQRTYVGIRANVCESGFCQ